MPHRLWRRVHYLTLGVWAASTAHGLLAGTDRRDTWLLALFSTAVASVLLAFLTRFARRADAPAIAATAATAGVCVLALAFAR
jgi:hypothetical protein